MSSKADVPHPSYTREFLYVEGIPGSCTLKNKEGWIEVLGVQQKLSKTNDGIIQIPPFIVRKLIDKSSLLLIKAWREDEEIEKVVYELLGGAKGGEVIVYQVTIISVKILNVEIHTYLDFPSTSPYNKQLFFEDISFYSDEITYTWVPDGVTFLLSRSEKDK